jgi:RHS repeat-associated protein
VPRKALQQVWADIQQITSGWLSSNTESLVWLHTNHLGAPEAATDQSGQVVWRASYAPFGAATVIAASTSASTKDGVTGAAFGAVFQLNLRLPGQTFDPETGLHHNRQRYYDPALGQYLTPDPLGTPDGPNPYAYVAFNPLTNIDPDGLILFAFDGTENTDDLTWLAARNGSLSNVVEFQRLYNDGDDRYITGVGTVDNSDPARPILAPNGPLGATLTPDKGFNYSGPARIARMVEYFNDEADLATENNVAMNVDIIGFSRCKLGSDSN